jgi:adenosylcobinamide-GDP ribazoletransferase
MAGRSVAYFPLVGGTIGISVAALDAALRTVLPLPLVTALDLALFALITGGLHLDGLMDSCDGLFVSDRERRLAIMRDSHVGSFGVAGAVLVLLTQYSALISLHGSARTAALIAVPALSRWAMTLAVWGFPYARTDGLGTPFKVGVGWPQVLLATMLVLLVAILAEREALWLVPATFMVTGAAAGWIRHRLGGLTGDSYGAIEQVITTVLVVALVAGAK